MDFTFKGVSTSTYGVILNSLDWFGSPEYDVDITRYKGRDGSSVTEDSYAPIVLRCRITLLSKTNMDTVIAWLTGSGVLSFSEDTGKYRTARVNGSVRFKQVGAVWEASFSFYCADPYRYVASEADTTITGKPATNLITNSGFDNGTTGWDLINVTRSVTNAELTQTATAQNGRSFQTPIAFITGNKYYLGVYAKHDSTSITHQLSSDGGATNTVLLTATANSTYTWYTGLGTANGTSGYLRLANDGRASGWTAQYIKYVVLLNLTAIYGAGNEPTKAEMDTIFASNYALRWFETNGTFLSTNTFTNSGTVASMPLIKVSGTGTVSITVNNTMSVALDTAYVHIDSDLREVYHLTTLKNRLATGDFPYLAVGVNAITVTGTVTEIVITPRTRYL